MSELQRDFMDALMVLKAAHELMPEDVIANPTSPHYLTGLAARQLDNVYDRLDRLDIELRRAIGKQNTAD